MNIQVAGKTVTGINLAGYNQDGDVYGVAFNFDDGTSVTGLANLSFPTGGIAFVIDATTFGQSSIALTDVGAITNMTVDVTNNIGSYTYQGKVTNSPVGVSVNGNDFTLTFTPNAATAANASSSGGSGSSMASILPLLAIAAGAMFLLGGSKKRR